MNDSIQIQQLRDSNLLLRRTIAFLCAKLGGDAEISQSDLIGAGDPAVQIFTKFDGSVTVSTAPPFAVSVMASTFSAAKHNLANLAVAPKIPECICDLSTLADQMKTDGRKGLPCYIHPKVVIELLSLSKYETP